MTVKRTRLGFLTPSSNTALEPIISAIISGLDDVSAHFGRFAVTEISLTEKSRIQFNFENQLNAAALLADAKVDAIVWSGTSASWLGFETDEEMCRLIEQHTNIPAGSSVLAVNQLFHKANVKRFGLVTPYASNVQDAIIENYAGHGFECIAERHLGEIRNYEFAEFSEEAIAEMILAVAREKPDAITIMCTNMRGARIAAELEIEIGIPIFDSTSAAVWSGFKIAGADHTRITDWGRTFETA